jgi:hypothetical protein
LRNNSHYVQKNLVAINLTICYNIKRALEKYSRGRRGAPAKGVGRTLTGARVQISPSPPKRAVFDFGSFLF